MHLAKYAYLSPKRPLLKLKECQLSPLCHRVAFPQLPLQHRAFSKLNPGQSRPPRHHLLHHLLPHRHLMSQKTEHAILSTS
ncbi:hypothetical protein HanXRQr2_Chr15g0712851 [Helianthus annuus]|uniref:Uncharacterized protein n=1 Tax=Helianthus annuus TaxID=4232 RepID=A0A9K3H4M8_HELAN|nr:hypothetical protein HanXRQr2_Chr15g0712851 [Helianthus annuus]KAJ0832908.1 hypothetical protein HanPSC8_Chr15g0684131 [Helianthus annuus]